MRRILAFALILVVAGCSFSYRMFKPTVTIRGENAMGTAISLGDGLYLTKAHVINGKMTINAQPVEVIKKDDDVDLAIVKSDYVLPAVKFADKNVRTLDAVYIFGAGLGMPLFATEGIVSNPSIDVNGHKMIQFSAPTYPGMSGAGLFNDNFELVGVVGAVRMMRAYAPLPVYQYTESIALATPLDIIKEFLNG